MFSQIYKNWYRSYELRGLYDSGSKQFFITFDLINLLNLPINELIFSPRIEENIFVNKLNVDGTEILSTSAIYVQKDPVFSVFIS